MTYILNLQRQAYLVILVHIMEGSLNWILLAYIIANCLSTVINNLIFMVVNDFNDTLRFNFHSKVIKISVFLANA